MSSNLHDDLNTYAYNCFTAGCPISTCIFYSGYCDYAHEKYQGEQDPLPFEEVDCYITEEMEIASVNDEYCP